MPFRADLHCHSTCSDGSCTPQELIDLAIEKGLSGLSITDHDTVDAYSAISDNRGLKLLTGVEFSTVLNGKSVHILGYGIDVSSQKLLDFCAKHQERRRTRNRGILSLLEKQGMVISEEELFAIAGHTVGRPHIAELLVSKGYVDSHQKAFQKYIGDGKSCYIQGDHFSIEETLDIIHGAGGISVLAHPHLYHGKRFVKTVLEKGIRGLECDYACFPKAQNAPWHRLAEELSLLKTAGSDFHGKKKPGIPLGASCVDEKTFSTLIISL